MLKIKCEPSDISAEVESFARQLLPKLKNGEYLSPKPHRRSLYLCEEDGYVICEIYYDMLECCSNLDRFVEYVLKVVLKYETES